MVQVERCKTTSQRRLKEKAVVLARKAAVMDMGVGVGVGVLMVDMVDMVLGEVVAVLLAAVAVVAAAVVVAVGAELAHL